VIRSLKVRAATWLTKRLLKFLASQTEKEVDETEAFPTPPQSPLTQESCVMMYTPPAPRVMKTEAAPLAGSARARAEQARKRTV
jgi:hypothetical protein